MAVQKDGRCRLVMYHLLAMTTTAVTTAHHMEHIHHRDMTTPATMIIRHITASRLLTGVVMPRLLPAMHLHILVCYTQLAAIFCACCQTAYIICGQFQTNYIVSKIDHICH